MNGYKRLNSHLSEAELKSRWYDCIEVLVYQRLARMAVQET
jgi:hypothetical protein